MVAENNEFLLFKKEMEGLVERFAKNIKEYKAPHTEYLEARLREDYLNPMLVSLGWDVGNRKGYVQNQREVEIESRTRIGFAKKRADYLFRIEGTDVFILEAKQPREELTGEHIFQAKRYAWNKDLPLAVLSDFEELKFFIVTTTPRSDEESQGHYKTFNYLNYLNNLDEIWNILSYKKVKAGSIAELLNGLRKKGIKDKKHRQGFLILPEKTKSLDEQFLQLLEEARSEIGKSIAKTNKLEDREPNFLNEVTQKIIDRILFLRICEDRDIDTGTKLESIVSIWRKQTEESERGGKLINESLYTKLASHFKTLDRRPPGYATFFNGQIFQKHPSEELNIDDDVLASFLDQITDETSPYLFNVMPVDHSISQLLGRGWCFRNAFTIDPKVGQQKFFGKCLLAQSTLREHTNV